MKELIKAIKITTGYQKANEWIVIHKEIDFEVSKGQFISVLGHNGSGKSTLFRSISNLQPLLSGSILLNGKEIQKYSKAELSQQISIVVSEAIVNQNLKVKEVIESGRYPYISWSGKLSKQDYIIVEKSISQVGMRGFEERKISTLSDGELQRILIARALCQKTDIILLDEPTSHLDIEGKYSIMKLLKDISVSEEKTILISTHDIDLALETADTIWLIDKERKLRMGKPDALIQSDAFSQVFDNENFTFNKETGRFVFKENFKTYSSSKSKL